MKRILLSVLLVLTLVMSNFCCVSAAEIGSVDWFKSNFETAATDPDSNNVEVIEVPVEIKVKANGADDSTYADSITTKRGNLVDLKATLNMENIKKLVALGKSVMGENYNGALAVVGEFVIKTTWENILEVSTPLMTGSLAGFKFYEKDGDELNEIIFTEDEPRDNTAISSSATIKTTTTVEDVINKLPDVITLEHTGMKVLNAGDIDGEFVVKDAFAEYEEATYTKVAFDSNDPVSEWGYVNYNFTVTPAEIKIETSSPSGGGVTTYPVKYIDENGNSVLIGRYSYNTNIVLDEAPAAEGKVFIGWATEAGGEVVYKVGDTFKMPKEAVTLYPVFGSGITPGLNKEDHFAYIKGYPDGTVRPEANISREEVATIFFRLLDAETKNVYLSTENSFTDVESDRWSNEAIATLAKAGIINGRTNSAFAPEAPITRAEFATIAARFDSEEYTADEDMFNDITGHWAAEYINRAATRGWVTGDGDGTFRPDDYITRAEAATLINRVLERNPKAVEDLLDEMIEFPDNADVNAWYYLNIQEAANDHDYVRKEDGVYENWVSL